MKDPLDKLSAKRKKKRLDKDKRDRFFTWLHLSMVVQMSVADIVQWEKQQNSATYTQREVTNGLKTAHSMLGDGLARNEMQRRHGELADNSKRRLISEFQRILDMAKQNGGYGITVTETTQDTVGGKTKKITTKTKVQSHIPELVALSREIREWDKFQAMLYGLMTASEIDNAPTKITIDIPGFESAIFTKPEDAPELPAPKELEDRDGE